MIARLVAGLEALLRENADVIACGVLLAGVRPLIAPSSALLRPDHLPWIALALSIAGALRGRGWGAGMVPGLTPRRDTIGRVAGTAVRALVPVVLLMAHDAAAALDVGPGLVAALGAIVLVGLHRVATRDGQTAWNPPGVPDAVLAGGGLAAATLPVLIAGFLTGRIAGLEPTDSVGQAVAAVDSAVFVGVGFTAIGVLAGNPRALRQRFAIRRHAGGSLGLSAFRPALAFFGPPLGLLPLLAIFPAVGSGRAEVLVLHVLVWTAVLWPPAPPAVRYCLLREIGPRGGREPALRDQAGFDAPPEGALRFHPLRTRESRLVHVWVVPVRDARIANLDDPVRVPWPRPTLPRAAHVLGAAAFEPDPLTGRAQIDEITVRVAASDDMMVMRAGEAQTRRLVVLRPYLPPGRPSRRELGAYRWESGVADQSRQVVDGNTTSVSLRHGDILVASSEGVARAYEVHFGDVGDLSFLAYGGRAPQVEDYVGSAG